MQGSQNAVVLQDVFYFDNDLFKTMCPIWLAITNLMGLCHGGVTVSQVMMLLTGSDSCYQQD